MKIFAHRGASAYRPQNTISAFQKAIDMNSSGIELDVQLSKDGVPVIIHDFTLEGTSNGKGLVRDKTLKELKALDVGSSYSPQYRGEKIPTLEEVLDLVPPSITLNIELKAISYFKEDLSQKVYELICKAQRKNSVIISSFCHPLLKQIQELDKTIAIGVLTGSDLLHFETYLEREQLNPFSLHPEVSYLTPEFCQMAHSRGIQVFPYTVNSRELGTLVENCGGDGFFSNFPDLLS